MSEEYDVSDEEAVSSDYQDDGSSTDAGPVDASGSDSDGKENPGDAKLVQRILQTIRRDKAHFKKAFGRMSDSMYRAYHGRPKDWSESSYVANITGQHVKTKTASLYAKNPRVVARRKESLDFLVWDETVQSLQMAMQVVQAGIQAQQVHQQAVAAAQMPAEPDVFAPMGHNGGPPMDIPPPAMPPGYDQALAVVQDFQEGMARRQLLKKFGRTLEIVFADAMRQQTPLDFKTSMKRLTRRALTTGVGYVEMGFQQQFGIPSAITEQLADHRQRIAHLEKMIEDASTEDWDECNSELAELRHALAALEAKPQVVLRQGLTFDFVQATKVIPDRLTTALPGFIGSNHLTVEYVYPKSEVEEMYKIKLGQRYTPYAVDGQPLYGSGQRGVDMGEDSTDGVFGAQGKDTDLVCLFKHYDKAAGLVYHVIDGYPQFVKEPSAPDVDLPRFAPVYPLTLNDIENEKEVFPKSDVDVLAPAQDEINRSRQGKREHRNAARPRWAHGSGALDEPDIANLKSAQPFDVIKINGLGPEQKVGDVLQPIPVPGVDPNLYDTNEVLQDATLTVGAQPAQLGGLSKSTATGVAVANDSASSVDSSSIDDMDSFLTMIARDGGIILMQNLTKEDVVKIAGRGAVWVEDLGMTLEEIYDEIYLEVEAGSTGKPNQAQEIRNMKDIGPLLLQVGSIPPEFLAREMLRRFDDRLDLTEAVVAGVPAIVAQNRMAQPAQGNPENDPASQGDEGGDKNATPSGPSGSSAPIGDNRAPGV